MEAVAGVGHVSRLVQYGDLLPEAGRLEGLHARATDAFHEQSAGEERLVADHLGRQAKAGAAGEQPVVGIAGERLRGRLGCLPVGRREHDRLED